MQSASFWRIAKYNKPEWHYGLVATIGSALQGAIMPFFAVALSSLIGSFYSTDMNYLKHQTTKWCLVLVGEPAWPARMLDAAYQLKLDARMRCSTSWLPMPSVFVFGCSVWHTLILPVLPWLVRGPDALPFFG